MAYLKTRPAWIQLMIFISIAFGIFIIISMIGVMILGNITGINVLEMGNPDNWDFNNPALLSFIRGMLVIQFIGLFLLPNLIFAYFADPRPLDYLGLKKPGKSFYYLAGALALVVSLPLVDWLGAINREVVFPDAMRDWLQKSEDDAARQIEFLLSRNTTTDLLINLVVVAVFAGVGEELLFRGVLQRLLIRIFKSPMAGIIVVAFVFSAIHFQFFGFLPRFILGIVLGLIYWYSGSLWPAIIAHFVYDAVAVIAVHFNPELLTNTEATLFTDHISWIYAVISLVLMSAIIWYMKVQSNNTYEKVYADDEIEEPFST
jgi:membrane protease YdiL (CAAX protease family)